MKNVCSILITVVILTHLQCGASCLSESLANIAQTTPVSAEPPCHQHAKVPANSPHAPHETNTPCTQGPVLEAKIMLSGKWVQQAAAILPPAVPIVSLDQLIDRTLPTYNPFDLWSSLNSLSVLRI